MNKSWVQELHEEFNFYDYKGKKVIAKTEKEKIKIANDHQPLSDQKQKDAEKNGVLVYPESLFLRTSYTEQSVDEKIKKDKKDKIELKKSFALKVKSSLSPRQLKKKRQEDLMKSLSSLVELKFKKKPLIAKMRGEFPKLSSAQICRFINNQLKSRVIEIDRTFKTKPIIVKGKLWRSL